MKWNYKCPLCSEWSCIDWEDRFKEVECDKTKLEYYPPLPSAQYEAYLDTHDWTPEIEETVIKLKGNKCVERNCRKDYETLDHRTSYTKGGKTSVENLYPMCNACNQSKGDEYYQNWLLKKLFGDA